MIQMPAGVVPQSQVNIDETNAVDRSKAAKETMREAAGMPIGVQVAGRREEEVMRVMREIEEKVKFKVPKSL